MTILTPTKNLFLYLGITCIVGIVTAYLCAFADYSEAIINEAIVCDGKPGQLSTHTGSGTKVNLGGGIKYKPHFHATAFFENKAWLLSTDSPVLLITEDGGDSWQKVNTPLGENTEFTFISRNEGWAVSSHPKNIRDAIVFHTMDSGYTWCQIAMIGETTHNSPVSALYNIRFINKMEGWITELGANWKTTDGGKSWVPNTDDFGELGFISGQNTWRYDKDNQKFSYSPDNGRSWESRHAPTPLQFIFFFNEQVGWVMGNIRDYYELYSTKDGGKTWELILKTREDDPVYGRVALYGVEPLQILSPSEGWVSVPTFRFRSKTQIKSTDWQRHEVLLHTKDAGKSWQVIEVADDVDIITKIVFSLNGWGWVETGDTVFYTTNGGRNWKRTIAADKLP